MVVKLAVLANPVNSYPFYDFNMLNLWFGQAAAHA